MSLHRTLMISLLPLALLAQSASAVQIPLAEHFDYSIVNTIRNSPTGVHGVSPFSVDFTATLDTSTATIENIVVGVTTHQSDFVALSPVVDLTRTVTIDPPGFPPPFTQTDEVTGAAIRASFDVSFKLSPIATGTSRALDPFTLATTIQLGNVFQTSRILEVVQNGQVIASRDLGGAQRPVISVFMDLKCSGTTGSASCNATLHSRNLWNVISFGSASFDSDLWGPAPSGGQIIDTDYSLERLTWNFRTQPGLVPEPSVVLLLVAASIVGVGARRRSGGDVN